MISLVEDFCKDPANLELEARYHGVAPVTRAEYMDVVKALALSGFTSEGGNKNLLRISVNGYRVEIAGLLEIQTYCTDETVPKSAIFVKKTKTTSKDSDYGMRLAIAKEVPLEEDEVQTLRRQWATYGKKYRYLSRNRLVNPKFPHWAIDCTITKSSYANVYRFSDSDLFSAQETFEIEAEAVATPPLVAAGMLAELTKITTTIVGGLQGTKFPITHQKIGSVTTAFQKLLKINPALPPHQQFVAPNPVALQIENLGSTGSMGSFGAEDVYHEDNTVSVLKGYAVTDKTDGVRKLLFIDGEGAMYLVNSRLKIENMRSVCLPHKNTVLDGEAVEGRFVAFDVYMSNGEDCRALKLDARLKKMADILPSLSGPTPILSKQFYQDKDVFEACRKCLATTVPYKTDGLIFIPVDKGVGYSAANEPPPNKSYTWPLNFKWKPPALTTIDFLVRIQHESGDKNLVVLNVLCRGSKNWALPQTALLEQSTHVPASKEGIRPFVTEEDDASHLCYVNVVEGDMTTPNGSVFKNGDVVEFSYCPEAPELWKWKPVRPRPDKESPNTFITAYNNWNAIQHPITKDMIEGDAPAASHKYYTGNRHAMPNVRKFHRWVKKQVLEKTVSLLQSTSINLFDLGVGQAGDLNRWRNCKLNFVFGVDINRDNITNRQNGACIRFLTTNKGPMRAIFAVADVSKNLFQVPTPLDQLIVAGVFGKVPKDQVEKYPNLAAHYNTSFQIVSCMFCVHYMFESMLKLEQFVENVAGATAVGGYFIGTAWDGKDIFALLRDVRKGESRTFGDFTITKQYSHLAFEGDPVAVGYPIDVSQNTFHQTVEYLVDFQGLTTLLMKKGFKLVELQSFRHYYSDEELTPDEKTLSFANHYFLFQKMDV